jgi:hypothetical protein
MLVIGILLPVAPHLMRASGQLRQRDRAIAISSGSSAGSTHRRKITIFVSTMP